MKALGRNNSSLFASSLNPSGSFIIFNGCFCPPGWPSDTAGGVIASVWSWARITVCAYFRMFPLSVCFSAVLSIFLPPAGRWIGYTKLCSCVSECYSVGMMDVNVRCTRWWAHFIYGAIFIILMSWLFLSWTPAFDFNLIWISFIVTCIHF